MHNAASMDLRDIAFWNELISPGRRRPLTSDHIANKRILITGAGGSVGSALTQTVHASAPSSLILLDTSENALYQIDRSLHEVGSHQHIPILGSVTHRNQLSHLFDQHRPQIIFHAAALKHVPLMEQNPFAAIDNNALGTLTLAEAAAAHHAEHLILVSTDKAVDPLSIMGASKRIAELILLALGNSTTRMTAVRLCNVIGSQGSVLPLFLDQLAHNHPLTVTHREAPRYFISIDRAIEAIYAALQSRSNAAILIPDPGPPVRILDLAQHLLRTHASSAPITFTGLRPGDKLTEHLLSSREHLVSTHLPHTPILRAIESSAPTLSTLHTALDELRAATQTHDLAQLLRAIQTLVPEYQPSGTLTNQMQPAPEMQA
jgi:FlaA1/EpsC-like NDP-sugar epimerase